MTANSFQGCRHHQRMDSLKRKRRQSAVAEKQYSTWHDKYAKIDRFFLICSPGSNTSNLKGSAINDVTVLGERCQ